MFDRVLGLPAHPLLVHAAVVLVPLLAFGGIAYAVVPFLRRHLRWPVGLLALAAPVAILAAKLAGDQFRKNKNLSSPELQTKIAAHSNFGNTAMWFTIGLAVLVLVLMLLIRPAGAGGLKRGPEDTLVTQHRGGGQPLALQLVLGVLTIGVAGATLYYVFRVGDSGGRMVWGGF